MKNGSTAENYLGIIKIVNQAARKNEKLALDK